MEKSIFGVPGRFNDSSPGIRDVNGNSVAVKGVI